MDNQIVLAMDDEHNKFVEPDLDAINGEVPEEEEEEDEDEVDEYHRRQYSSHQEGLQSLDKVDSAGYNLEQSGHHGRDSSEGKLFVGGISWETTEETFSNYFRKFGEIADSVIMMDKITGRPRGFGFITFSDPADADKVLEKEHVIDGRAVEVKRTVPREDMQQQQQVSKGVTKTKKIFVGGIPPSFTEDEMKEYFSSYGSIVEHQIMLDHSTGRSRGFGFVTFETEDAVESVFLDGQRHELGGKQVEIKRAEPKRSEGGFGGSAQRSSYGGTGFRSSGAGYGDRNLSRGGYGGAKGRGYGGGGGYDNYESYDSYSGNYGGGAAGFYGGYGAGGYGYGFGGSMYGAPGGYPGYGVVPGYGTGRGYGVGAGVGGYGAGRGYGSSDGGYGGGRGYSGGMEGGYGAQGYGGGVEGGYGPGRGYGSGEGEYGNSRGGYDSSSSSTGGSRGRGSGSVGGGRGYGSTGSGVAGSTRYHPYQRQ
uniref:RRM domain-containing protein n=1 Tax=Kalanchoe fedtschenkoi TaxID=63787 RepID=A0A7N0UWU8_KALFE